MTAESFFSMALTAIFILMEMFATPVNSNPDHYLVTRVVDGDTLEIVQDQDKVKVRLVGIDTPEMTTKSGQPECFAIQSTTQLIELVQGKHIRLVSDSIQPDKDRYGRLLRYVYLEDVPINAYLVENGFARAYTSIKSDKLGYYQALEILAQEEKRGLWGACEV